MTQLPESSPHTPEENTPNPQLSEGENGLVFGAGLSPEEAARLASVLNRLRDEPKELEVYGDEDDAFVVQLRNIAQKLGISQDVSVIYPGSHVHVGVARVFGKEHVTHVDPDADAMRAMQKAGYSVVELPIEEYIPEQPAGLVVALNSYGQPTRKVMDRLLVPGGYVVANNWTGWAHNLSGIKGYETVGAIMPTYSSPEAAWVDSADLPDDSAGKERVYYKMAPGEPMSIGTPDDHTYADDEYRNADALFVFRRKPNKDFSGIMRGLIKL